MTHTTVEKHIKSLEEKHFLVVMRRHSNSYMLRSNIEANPYIILSETLHKINHVMRNSRIENERKQIEKIRKIVKSDIYTEAIGKLIFIYDYRLTYRGGADSWLEMYRDDLIKFINVVHEELEDDYGFSHIFSDRKEFHSLILKEG